MTGVNGFQLKRLIWAVPFRRWVQAAWYQPVARIGANADAELPLQDIDGASPDALPRPLHPTDPDNEDTYPVKIEKTVEFADLSSELRRKWSPPPGTFDPIPKDALPPAQQVWRKQGLSARMVADFTAEASGELFLYVNDAIQLAPFVGPFDLFYGNNSGSADVTVQRMPLPPPK